MAAMVAYAVNLFVFQALKDSMGAGGGRRR